MEKLSTPQRRSAALAQRRPCSVLAGLFLLVVPLPVMAMPMFGDEFSHLQPDGTRVTVRIWGDEFYRVVESLDGYTLAYDGSSKAGCYARLSPDGNQLVSTGVWAKEHAPAGLNLPKHLRITPDAKHARIAEQRALHDQLEREALAQGLRGGGLRVAPPNIGNVQAIVLIVDFSDDPATIPASNVDNYCNQIGYTGYGNNGSVRDYYYEVSDGALTYTNYVPPAYHRASQPKSYYTDPSIGYGIRAQEMIIEALNDLNGQGFDFSQYDSNGDGFIDGINCFYAGSIDNAWAEGLWPHSSSLTWSADGVSTLRYQVTNIGSSLKLATFCHENGHMICYWPDLYDYDYDSTGVGRYCLMSNSGPSTNPVEPCGYLKYDANWTITTILSTLQSNLPVPSDSNTIYKYEHPSKWNEYYVIENRQKMDRDAALPDAGLAIWHIDELGNNSANQMTEASHFEATLVQADGLWNLEHNQNSGDSTDLWADPGYTACAPDTNPDTNWWDGTSSDLYISQISPSGVDMTFTFGPPGDCNGNGVPDFDDIASGTSLDCNADSRPDECGVIEDCELDKLPGPDPLFFFGWSVAMDGDVAVVGMSRETCPAGTGCGSADVYRFDGTHWVFEQNLTAPVREAEDMFGWKVAVEGNLIVIGAIGDKCEGSGVANCGSVFLYRYAAGGWTLEDAVQASDAATGDSLGGFVSVRGSVVVAGAYLDDCPAGVDCGSAYVFRNNAGTWTEEAKLVAPDAAGNDWFGNSVAVADTVIAVGADGDDCPNPDDGNCGGVYMFSYDGANWNYDEKITEAFGFGFPVAISGDILMVGAPFESCSGGTNCGGVYVYRFNGVDWNHREIRLASPGPAAGDFFGRSIGLSGNLAVIGASGVDCPAGVSCGRGYTFRNIATNWARDAELAASDASNAGQMGLSASVSGNMVMMGSNGAAYAYSLGDADCDCNAVSDVCEVNAGTAADANGNGVIDDCENSEPLPAPYPHDRRKNRYISFDPNKEANDGTSVAFKVEMKAITLGSCNGLTGGTGDFCRADRGAADCNACSGAGNACINQAIDCSAGETCTPTGESCVNDAPNSGGSNIGAIWWVGPESPLSNGVHLLVSTPFRLESVDWPNPVHVGDCEIVPEAAYGIRAVTVGTGGESDELIVETTQFATASSSWWGDCVGPLKKFCGGDIRNPLCAGDGDCTAPETCDRAWTLPDGSVNFDDINAALALVAPGPTSVAPDPTWVDLHGNATGTPGSQNFDPPNFVLNFSDIGQILSGFGGFPYKGYDPKDCPDSGTWP